MKYFQILNCSKDPFLGKPSAELFCPIAPHTACLNNLVMAVKSSQQPLHAVIGDIGSGKTTLFLQLQRKLSIELSNAQVINASTTWISSKKVFLGKLAETLGISKIDQQDDKILLNKLKTVLSQAPQKNSRNNIILIDQAEQLPSYCLEVLEELFGEKSSPGSLQFVFFGREIFIKKIGLYFNISQSSNIISLPKKIGFADARNLLVYYLTEAESALGLDSLFSPVGLYSLYYHGGGNPGRIIGLFRLTLVNQISQDRKKAGGILCRQAAKEIYPEQVKKFDKIKFATLAAVSIMLLVLITTTSQQQVSEQLPLPAQENTKPPLSIAQETPATESTSQNREEVKPPTQVAQPEISTQKHVVDILKSLQTESKQEKISALQPPPEEEKSPPAQVQLLPKKMRTTSLITQKSISKTLPTVLPPNLGAITVFEQETLGDMIRRIYGPYSFTPGNSKKVLANNPHISNKHMLSIGDQIIFPTMGVKLTPEAEETHWIHLVTIKKLQDAYRYLRIYAKEDLKLIILPSWSGHGVFQFDILLEENFVKQKDAESRLAQLSKDVYPKATILTGLDRNFFYFANTDPKK